MLPQRQAKEQEEDAKASGNTFTHREQGLKIDNPKIYKSTKFACKSLKGTGNQSGIRVIYAYYEDIDKIEFIEIYYKGYKETGDRENKKILQQIKPAKKYF